MSSQHRAGEVVEAGRACFASVALPVRLRVVAPVPDHRGTVAARTAYALRSAMLAHKREALGVVHQAAEIDQVGCRHDGGASSREPVGWSHSAITSDTCRRHHPGTRQEPRWKARAARPPVLPAPAGVRGDRTAQNSYFGQSGSGQDAGELGVFRHLSHCGPKWRLMTELLGAGHLGRRYHSAVQVPGRVAQHRHRDRKPNEQRDAAEHQHDADDEAPGQHRDRIGPHRADRRLHG